MSNTNGLNTLYLCSKWHGHLDTGMIQAEEMQKTLTWVKHDMWGMFSSSLLLIFRMLAWFQFIHLMHFKIIGFSYCINAWFLVISALTLFYSFLKMVLFIARMLDLACHICPKYFIFQMANGHRKHMRGKDTWHLKEKQYVLTRK